MAKGKPKTLRSTKGKATKLLSKFIGEIAKEKTELEVINGEDKLITKAEALSRLIWKSALGYKEQKLDGVKLIEIDHAPSRVHQQIILERMEGKIIAEVKPDKEDGGTVDKVTKEVTKRINAINVDTE